MTQAAAFTLILCIVAAVLLVQTLLLGRIARLAPIWIIVPTFLLLLVQLVVDLRPEFARRLLANERQLLPGLMQSARARETPPGERPQSAMPVLLWIVGLAALVLGLGVLVGVPLFLLAYLATIAGLAWWRAALVALGALALLYIGFPVILEMPLAPGWLWSTWPR